MKKGEIFNNNIYCFDAEQLIGLGIIEEVKEKPKPKYKVGDRVVVNGGFTSIYSVRYGEGIKKFLYNGYLESALRTPTEEELSIYYR